MNSHRYRRVYRPQFRLQRQPHWAEAQSMTIDHLEIDRWNDDDGDADAPDGPNAAAPDDDANGANDDC